MIERSSGVGQEIGTGRGVLELLLDELAYRFVATISKRALKKPRSFPPIAGSLSDLITHRLVATGYFESSQMEMLDVLLKDRILPRWRMDKLGVMIDVGANVGLYSIRYYEYFEQVLAIEANPITYKLLEANIMLHRLNNVLPINRAASDKIGQVGIVVRNDGNLGWSSIGNKSDQHSDQTFELPVDCDTLDNLKSRYAAGPRVDLIKIDVEGHEASVIRGAAQILTRDKPVVLYERSVFNRNDCIEDLLVGFGYNTFTIFKRHVSLLAPTKTKLVLQTIDASAGAGEYALICAQ